MTQIDSIFKDVLIFEKGQVILEEGNAGESGYIIISGEVAVYKERRGKKILVSRLGKHELIGEICLFKDESARSASVVAFTDRVEVVELPKDLFDKEMASLSPHMKLLITALVQRLKSNYNQIAFLS